MQFLKKAIFFVSRKLKLFIFVIVAMAYVLVFWTILFFLMMIPLEGGRS